MMGIHIKFDVISNENIRKGNGLMINQKWQVTVEEESCVVEYKCTPLTGKTELCVDGVSFAVRGKPFGIGLARHEMIMVCGVQGILDVQKGGHANLIVRDGTVTEMK
jgi:hypothetical protein